MANVWEIAWVRSTVGTEPFIVPYPEAAAQTYVKGDPLVLNASGQVALAVDTGNAFGIAVADASGTTNADAQVIVIRPEVDVFSASQSAAGATQVTVQTQVGLRCSFIKSTITGHVTKTVVDTSDVGNLHIEIINLDTRDAVGLADGRVEFRWVPAKVVAR